MRLLENYHIKRGLITIKVDFDFENIQYQDSQWKDETLFKLQRQFAYTKEEIHKYIQELVEGKKDPIGAMGYDAPIAVLNRATRITI